MSFTSPKWSGLDPMAVINEGECPPPMLVTSYMPLIEANQHRKKAKNGKTKRTKLENSSKVAKKPRVKNSAVTRKTGGLEHKQQNVHPQHSTFSQRVVSMQVQHKPARAKASRSSSKPNTTRECELSTTYNSVDEVIDEANAFLQCAHEAQALGMFHKAHTYLILAHGRLIGLGRFIEYGDAFGKSDGLKSDEEMDNINHEVNSSAMQSSHYGLNSTETPGASLPPKKKVTPSPTNKNQLQSISQGTPNNLSSNLAQWSQDLLYAVKGTGNSYATHKKRKDSRLRQKKRAASFDSTVSTSEIEQANPEINMQYKRHNSTYVNPNSWSASIMTADFACFDAKMLMKKSAFP